MNIENTKAQMRKGVFRVLHSISIKRKDAYTSEILDTLKSAKIASSRRNCLSPTD